MIRIIIFLFAGIFSVSPVFGSDFNIVGARALGMGGANVAAANDATTVYWNPAGMALSAYFVDVTIPVTAAVDDRIGIKDTVNQLNSILAGRSPADPTVYSNPATVAQIQALLSKLAQPGTEIDLSGSAGVLFQTRILNNHIALSGLDLLSAAANPIIDTVHINATNPLIDANSIYYNTSQFNFIGLDSREFTLSYANSLLEGFFLFGGNAKLIKGTSYFSSTASGSLFNYNTNNFVSDFKNSKMESTAFSYDLGLMIQPLPGLRAGIVGRDLNGPQFNTSAGTTITLTPQVRSGIAIAATDSLMIAADLDLTNNPTLIPGVQSRQISLGLEKNFFNQILSLRLGGYKDFALDHSNAVGTAGVGLRLAFFHLDLGGGYDFQQQQALGSATLAVRF